MSDAPSCTLPRVPAAHLWHPWESTELDIAGCGRTEVVVPLHEHEKAGTRPETWPDEVRRLVFKFAEKWVDEHADRGVRAITYGIQKSATDNRLCCVVILHHAPKG